jgi:hypothetical protein
MLSIKPGAKLEGLQPEILVGILVIKGVLDKYGVDVVITEGTAGEHMQGSLHYRGLAVDIRSKHILDSEIKHQILVETRVLLNDEFDFILECEGQPNEHFHMEADFK